MRTPNAVELALGHVRPRRFSALYRDNVAFVRAAIRRLGVPPWLEDDAVQDVFVVAHRHFDGFIGERHDGWLLLIARRVAFRHRRAASRQRRKFDALRTWLGLAARERPWQAPEARVLLGEMTRRLAGAERQAFELCEVQGYTALEAGTRLGINPNTVATRLRSARQELRAVLADTPRPRTPSRFELARGWMLLVPRLVADAGASILHGGVWAFGTALAVVGVAVAVAPPPRVAADPVARAASVHTSDPDVAVDAPATVVVPRIAATPSLVEAVPIQRPRRTAETPSSLPLLGAEDLAAAARALARGRTSEARALLDEHAHRYPASPLAPERARLRALLDASRP